MSILSPVSPVSPPDRLTAARRCLAAAVLLLYSATAPAAAGDARLAEPLAPLLQAVHEAEAALAEDELQIAESRYRTALVEGWILTGLLAEAEGRHREAAAAYETASTAAVSHRRATTLHALARLRLGEIHPGIALLREVLRRHPADRRARTALAQALVDAGRPEEAVQELEEAQAMAPEDVETRFNLATGYLRLGELAKAEAQLDRVAAERPLPQTHVLIGRTYRDFDHFARAREALEMALEMDPQVRRAHFYLGTTELRQRGRDGIDAAIEHFRRELDLEPEEPLTNLYLGTALAESRRFEEAVAALETAARWPPIRFQARRFAGRCLLALGRVPEAVAALREALDLGVSAAAEERQLASTHYQLGLALRRAGDAAAAAEHFALAKRSSAGQVEDERERFATFLDDSLGGEEEAHGSPVSPQAARLADLPADRRQALGVQVEKELGRAYLNLGLLATKSGRRRRAVESLERASELAPDLPGLQAALGAAYFRAQRFGEATAPLTRALAAEPQRPELARMLAVARLNTGAYDEAAALLADDAARAGNPSLQYAYGLALVRAGRAAEAGPVFDALLAAHGDWPELQVLLGQAYAQEGDYPAAIRALQRALELDPEVAEAHATLGGIFLRQGRLAEARQALERELAAHPDDLRARYQLATVLDLDRQPEKARPLLEAVLRRQPDFADARYLLGKILLAQGAAEEAAEQLEAAARQAPEDANIHYQLAQAYQRLGEEELASRAFATYRDLKRGARGDGR